MTTEEGRKHNAQTNDLILRPSVNDTLYNCVYCGSDKTVDVCDCYLATRARRFQPSKQVQEQ